MIPKSGVYPLLMTKYSDNQLTFTMNSFVQWDSPLVAETIEPPNHRNCALNSEQSTIQQTVSQVYCGKTFSFGLGRFYLLFSSPFAQDENFTIVRVMAEFPLTYTQICCHEIFCVLFG